MDNAVLNKVAKEYRGRCLDGRGPDLAVTGGELLVLVGPDGATNFTVPGAMEAP